MSASMAVIGECMLELSHSDCETAGTVMPMAMKYGGDTINTSIYLSRNNITVSYVTGLGDDIMSDWLLAEWVKEGIDCSLVTRMPNSVPGIYMINVDGDGERSFLYWRKHSPASRLFDDPGVAAEIFQSIAHYNFVYLSGISLAILSNESRERLVALLTSYRQQGGRVIFDGNYRPNLWPSKDVARQSYMKIYQITDIALPTLEDEVMLFGYDTAEQVMQSIQDLGIPEIVVKMGGNGCLVLDNESVRFVDTEKINPVDTTAAGDSFNAGYLSARIKGLSGIDACAEGHALAAKVIQYPGAIIPMD